MIFFMGIKVFLPLLGLGIYNSLIAPGLRDIRIPEQGGPV